MYVYTPVFEALGTNSTCSIPLSQALGVAERLAAYVEGLEVRSIKHIHIDVSISISVYIYIYIPILVSIFVYTYMHRCCVYVYYVCT